MTAELLARIGGPLAGAGFAVLVLAPGRWPRLAGLAAWAAGLALLLPVLTPSGHAALAAAGGVFVLAVAVGLGVLFRRHPWSLPLLALAAAPARIPVTVGDASANLLLPLYAIVAGAALALAWSLWRDEPPRRELGLLALPAGLFVAWLGLSAAWTNDPSKAAVELFFFVLPFALLAVALARLPWSGLGLDRLARLLFGMAFLFAAVGIAQWATRDIFWNHKVVAGNAYASFFRVNSLFWDPSIYGRFLVVALLVATVVLLFGSRRVRELPVLVGLAVVWVGLLLSYSQSSFLALLGGLVAASVVAWRRRAVAVVAVLAVVALGIGLVAPQLASVRRDLTASSDKEVNRATRGRFLLVSNALQIAADHPVAGVGVGGIERAYRERGGLPKRIKTPASHNTAVTVAAENGLVGLLLFAWLLAAAAQLTFGRALSGRPGVRLVGLAAGVATTALFVHSLFYNAFLEDPMVWGFLALAALAAREAAAEDTRTD